jgi:hypothetical protein
MRQLPFVVLVLCSLCVGSAGLSAQPTTTTASVTTQAPIYLRPGAEIPLRVAAVGTRLEVLKEEGEWIEVAFNDPQYGRRVGWVQAKLIRISRPELQPMDLSVGETETADPPRVEPQPSQPRVADTPAARLQARDGFWFNAGLGFGSFGCENCVGRDNGLSGGLSMGGAVGDRVLLGVGTTGFAKQIDDEIFSVGTLDARVRVYPVRTSGFFLNGGVGLGSMSYAGESEIGVGVMLGVGWDVRLGRNVSLTPFWNGFAMSNANVDGNVGQLGIGITVH